MDSAPIGIFDSGLGGLTVARAVMDKLPHERIVYLGDTAHTPYGPRPIAQVRQLVLTCLDELVERGVKALVIACNTATAAALSDARERYTAQQGIPVIEVITPAARSAIRATHNRRIGIIGTSATIQSQAYNQALAAVPDVSVFSAACPRFVEFVEAGITTGPELEAVARDYLAPLIDADVDTVILGCTHYPLLTGIISQTMGEDVALVTSSEATANDTYKLLVERDMTAPIPEQASTEQSVLTEPAHEFLTTGAPETFEHLARRFLGPEVRSAHNIHGPASTADARLARDGTPPDAAPDTPRKE